MFAILSDLPTTTLGILVQATVHKDISYLLTGNMGADSRYKVGDFFHKFEQKRQFTKILVVD